ncbi:MAG TPA: glycosyl hydrolase, partial [Gemmatimonadales bacterium]|nr:glycosyl hydrolase [Gemmatimonadales bacterium]
SAGNVLQRFTSEPDSLTVADSLLIESRIDSLGRLGVSREAAEEQVRDLVRQEERSRETPARRRQPRVPNKAGLNRFNWDLRAADATDFEGLVLWFANTRGPVVPPGRYSVRMTAAGETLTASFAVLKDPRSRATPADLAEQYALASAIRDRTSMAHDAVRTIRSIRSQLEARQARLRNRSGAVSRAAAPLLAQLAEIERSIYQVKNRSAQDPLNYPIQLNNKIAALGPTVASAEAKPTSQTHEAFRVLSTQLDVELKRLSEVMERLVPPVNAALKRAGVEPLAL